MRHSRLRHYLRTNRLKAGLSQSELAQLLGVSEDVVSNVERERTLPTLAFVLGCMLIFGKMPANLFPGVVSTIEDGIGARAAGLDAAWRGSTDAASPKKLALLSDIADRLTPAFAV